MRYEFILFWVSILIAVAGVAICLREDRPVHPGSGVLFAPGADAGKQDGGTGRAAEKAEPHSNQAPLPVPGR